MSGVDWRWHALQQAYLLFLLQNSLSESISLRPYNPRVVLLSLNTANIFTILNILELYFFSVSQRTCFLIRIPVYEVFVASFLYKIVLAILDSFCITRFHNAIPSFLIWSHVSCHL